MHKRGLVCRKTIGHELTRLLYLWRSLGQKAQHLMCDDIRCTPHPPKYEETTCTIPISPERYSPLDLH